MDDPQTLEALRRCLRSELAPEAYASWFERTARLERRDGTLRVCAPNRFAVDWLARNYRAALERAIALTGVRGRLEFVVDETLSRSSDEGSTPREPQQEKPAAAPTARAARRTDYSLSRLVADESNRLALTAARMTIDRPGSVSPLVVYGPTAVGKTHLLRGIVSESLAAGAVRRGAYVTAEQFTTSFVEALRGGGLPNFRHKLRDVELLAIDDVQFFLGKRHTLVELLNTMATLERTGGQIVMAADRAPGELADLGPELATRIQGGMICPVGTLEAPARREIARRLAAEHGFELDEPTAQFLAENFSRHVRQLIGAVHRLHAAGQSQPAPWTPEAARAELADLLETDERSLRLADVERAVCTAFGLERQALQRGDKNVAINAARQLAMWLARRHTRAGLAEIGRYFGGRSHSTVASAHKRVDELRHLRSTVQINGRSWKIDEALAQVADRLRAVG